MKLSLSNQVLVFSQLQSPYNLLNKLCNKLTTFLDQLGNAYMINVIKNNQWLDTPPTSPSRNLLSRDLSSGRWKQNFVHILTEHFPKNRPVIRVNLDVKGGPPAHGRVALVVVPLLLHGDQEAG